MDKPTLPNETAPLAPTVPRGLGCQIWEFPATRILAYLLLTAVIAYVVTLPIPWIVRAVHIHFRGLSEALDLLDEILVASAAVGSFYIMSRWGDPKDARASGFERRGSVSETAVGLLIGAMVFSLAIGTIAAFGGFHVLGINRHAQLLLPLVLFLLVGVFEETIFRGYIFQTLELRWGSAVALCVSALLFGLAHLGNPVAGLTPTQRLAGPLYIVFEASILMSAAYLLTRRLWLPIGIHWGWNYFESTIYGTADSGMGADQHHTLLHSTLSGPFWLSGSKFGPEASTVCLMICTAAGLYLLHLAVRRGQWRPLHHHKDNRQQSNKANKEVIV